MDEYRGGCGLCKSFGQHPMSSRNCEDLCGFRAEGEDHSSATSTATSADNFRGSACFFDVSNEILDGLWHDAEGDLGAVVIMENLIDGHSMEVILSGVE